MKVRIIRVDDKNLMAGKFIVQERHWYGWDDLYFDPNKKILRQEQVLGQAGISIAEFDDWHVAQNYAVAYKTGCKRVIKEVWHID